MEKKGGLPLTETECILQLQQGNLEAFDFLFDQYKNTALRTAYLITGNYASSEDIVQETFLLCYQNIKKLKDPTLFRSWFFRILTRTAWKHCNTEKKLVPEENILSMTPNAECMDSSLEHYMQKETAQTLWQAISCLDKKQRTVIILYYYNELSIQEIASIVGCFSGTVKSRLYTARKNLKNSLLENEITERECHNNETYNFISRTIR